MDRLLETASQTAGPYVHIGLAPNAAGLPIWDGRDPGRDMIADGAAGERVALELRILDGLGDPVADAVAEIVQADAAGRFPGQEGRDPHVTGWARRCCGADGAFRLDTVRPGPVPHPQGMQAPHLALWIVARGINLGLHTRIYFEDDDTDPLLSRLPPSRRRTLVAGRDGDVWRHAIRLQGDGETVFLDV